MRVSLSARVFDPLWLMARQWQVGEFQGEDAGMPVLARVRSQTTMLSRIHLGELPANTITQAAAYDPQQMPLEVMVERQRTRPANANDARMLRLSVEAGLHFLLMLDQQPLSKKYRPYVHRTLRVAAAAPTLCWRRRMKRRAASSRRWSVVRRMRAGSLSCFELAARRS